MPIVRPPVPCKETVLVVTPSKVTPTDIPVTIPVPENFLSPESAPSGYSFKATELPTVNACCPFVSVSSK